jgi:hypothetical protein
MLEIAAAATGGKGLLCVYDLFTIRVCPTITPTPFDQASFWRAECAGT